MLLDHDAYVHDAYICDIRSLTMLHVSMMRLKFCHGRTNEQGDSRSRIVKIDRNAEHLQFIMEMALILLKRRGGKLSFYVFYIKVT